MNEPGGAFDYEDYLALFSTGDDEALLARYFNDDVRMTGGTRDSNGKEELRAFLAWAHDGVREVPRLQHYARDGEHLFAEIDMDFHASKVRDDFPFGKLRAGDMLTVKFLVVYRLRDGKVSDLKSMTWPAGQRTSRLPRLGAHPSQLAAYHSYVAAFSAGEFDRFSAFYTDDVTLFLGSIAPVHGRQGIVDFYRAMFPRVREDIIVHSVEATDDKLTVPITSRFTALVDAPDFVVAPLARGEAIEVPLTVHYDLREGLICRIEGIRSGDPVRVGGTAA